MNDIQKTMCNICKFTRQYSLKTHERTKHEYGYVNFSCYLCRKNCKTQDTYLNHINQHKEGLQFFISISRIFQAYNFIHCNRQIS